MELHPVFCRCRHCHATAPRSPIARVSLTLFMLAFGAAGAVVSFEALAR